MQLYKSSWDLADKRSQDEKFTLLLHFSFHPSITDGFSDWIYLDFSNFSIVHLQILQTVQ